MDKVERICRTICAMQYADPDEEVKSANLPESFGHTVPLWTQHKRFVEMVLIVIEENNG